MTETDLLIERTKATLKLVAAMAETSARAWSDRMEAQAQGSTPTGSTLAPMCSPADTDMECGRHFIAAPFDQTSVAPRYRRPRTSCRLPRSAPLVMRLAAQGALPPCLSLLSTIYEVDESGDLDNFLTPSQSGSSADYGEPSRKRRTPDPDALQDPVFGAIAAPFDQTRSQTCALLCLAAHQMQVDSLEATLTPDVLEHWKRLRGSSAA